VKKIRIAITMGESDGIGPEVTLKALSYGRYPKAEFIVLGDPGVFQKGLRWINKTRRPDIVSAWTPEDARAAGKRLALYPCLDPAVCVRTAAEWALAGRVDALVTAPCGKKAFGASGTGHTEFLAGITGVRRVVMMLAGQGLRVALVTTHLPLRSIFKALTSERIIETVRITTRDLKKFFGIEHPRILLAALNPHAGEGGLLGKEERTLFPRVLKACRKMKAVSVAGPFPPDIVFHQALREKADAVVALYHDQGLIALKTIAFDSGVNITLGLPFIRTSPDHGTAKDIAGKNRADWESMAEAIRVGIKMAGHHQRTTSGKDR
jgi:4-hydroxythreonine-4-phosphate dehydrogenase